MSSLNNLLKQQIKDAIAHIYDESGSAADNRYSKPEELAKALLDILFPAEAENNSHITGVVRVPTVQDTESDGSTDSKKARKPRAPMSDEAKAAMKAQREATIAAKKAEATRSVGGWPKAKTCLKCRGTFASEGPHNHVCPPCQRSNASALDDRTAW